MRMHCQNAISEDELTDALGILIPGAFCFDMDQGAGSWSWRSYMRIVNGQVFGKDGKFHDSDVNISDGVFTDEAATGEIIDAAGCYVIPGLVDIHFHGALGLDICDAKPEAFEKIAEYEASCGVTAICPATLTLPVKKLDEVLAMAADFADKQSENKVNTTADLIGLNMEGPFISKVKKGAQNADYILPCNVDTANEFVDSSRGLVKFIGLAPEDNPGFEGYIKAMKEKVHISIAHSNADYDTAMHAFAAGACHAVHLYNAMTEMSHRAPGIVGAVQDSKGVTAEIICDGIHVQPSAVRAAFNMIGADRMVLISDSLRCTGMPDGQYDLGGQQVNKKGKYCTLVDGGNIAGSVSNLMGCMVNAVKTMDIPLETAVACATINPAKAIGEDARYGSIETGKKGNAVILDKNDLSVRAVIKNGEKI